MGQRSNDVALKDVLIMLRKEECVLGMGQRGCAAKKGVQIMSYKEVCALGTGQR